MLKITELGGSTPKLLNRCTSLSYEKECYTPYSSFRGSFLTEADIGEIIDAELIINGTAVHKGIIDSADIRELPSHKELIISSRSHTSMLGQNELVPGLISNASLNSLMTDYIQLPNVYHENISDTVNYIYVKEHASLWEALCNLCLKQYGTYPYIAGLNTIRYTLPANPKTVALSRDNANITAVGASYDYTKMTSDIHMKDTQGTYNTFNKNDTCASGRNIIRHRHIAFDRQWLDNPVSGLGYKLNFAMRGFKSSYVSYLGYSGEDLNDIVSFEGIQNKRISRINIQGGDKGLATKLTCYFDRYNNV